MDAIEDGILVGAYPGNIAGEVTLVGGKINKALYTNGLDQWVNIGDHRDKCLGNLARCKKGFVMALWLKVLKDPSGRKHFYVNSGGHSSKSMGITLHQKNMKLIAYYKTESEDWRITVEDFEAHLWYHVILTWRWAGAKFYLNGCLSGHQDGGIASVNNEEPWHADFVFGNSNTDLDGSTSKSAGEMTLDDVRVWDADMNEEDAWKLYTDDIIPWYDLPISGKSNLSQSVPQDVFNNLMLITGLETLVYLYSCATRSWYVLLQCIDINGTETLVCLRCYA